MNTILNFLLNFFTRDIYQILLIALALYQVVRFIRRGSRGSQVLLGLGAIVLVYFLVDFLNFSVIQRLLPNITQSSLIILCILFQEEIRQFFAGIADKRAYTLSQSPVAIDTTIETLVRTARDLSNRKIGAIIAIERNESLAPFEQAGRVLDVPLIQDLLVAIFYPKGPLHDGGVIIRDGRIAVAGCVFPISLNVEHDSFGTRHRAAIGLSESSDAFVIVVSEETGSISVAVHGALERDLDADELRERLASDLHHPESLQEAADQKTATTAP